MSIAVYTCTEVAEILKIHPQSVYRLVSTGEIGYVKVSKSVRITEEHIEEFLRRKNKKPNGGENVDQA